MHRALILALGFSSLCFGADHVQWSLAGPEIPAGKHGIVKLTATIDSGWHLYSLTTPPGPIPTTIRLEPAQGMSLLRTLVPPPERKFDPGFQNDTETYEGTVAFLLDVVAEQNATSITALPRYQVCSGTLCIPPVTRKVIGELSGNAPLQVPAGYTVALVQSPSGKTTKLEAPWAFLFTAFGFGLAAVFTPCVFPMIPITMSFFLDKPGALKQAVLFCLGIVVLFSALGLIATSVLGPFGVVQLGSNVWERTDRLRVHCVRPKHAGCLRDHDSLIHSHATQPGFGGWRHGGDAADGPDVFPG